MRFLGIISDFASARQFLRTTEIKLAVPRFTVFTVCRLCCWHFYWAGTLQRTSFYLLKTIIIIISIVITFLATAGGAIIQPPLHQLEALGVQQRGAAGRGSTLPSSELRAGPTSGRMVCLVEAYPRECPLVPKSAVIFFFSALGGLTSYISCIQTLLHIGAEWGLWKLLIPWLYPKPIKSEAPEVGPSMSIF